MVGIELAGYKTRFKAWLQDHKRMPSLGQRLPELKRWFCEPAGQHLLANECRHLRRLLDEHRGQRILQLSLAPERCPRPRSQYRQVVQAHQLYMAPQQSDATLRVQCDFRQLPFEEHSVDVVIIQHLLEYSEEAPTLLKEAARVCSHGGHIIILAFNPLSLSGLWAVLSGRFRRHSGWFRHALLAYRIRDWLAFVDCKALQTRHICHSLPLRRGTFMWFGARFCAFLDKKNVPFSSVFSITARKEQAGMHLLKPDWRVLVLSRALQGARVAPSSAASKNRRMDSGLNRDN
ncbi:class I SAM-dependent methyltransferase [Agaribacterium haliotis]|uniref:class I SAM-dependent methyltransferase n=1 Tax=Agaribacterium haliotis TaxID=2013869 RepID=UPI000BB59037|nr:class I SAM-dependent methyltransferase [Agaribacterium haliotis]